MNEFIDTFLAKFCAIKNIGDKNFCLKNLSFLTKDYAKFLEKMYSFIKKQKEVVSMLDFKIVSSSGDSLIIIYPNIVFKIFNPIFIDKVKNEVKYSKMFSPYVINILDAEHSDDIAIIAYEKVQPLNLKTKNLKASDLLLLIKDVGEALDSLMLKGYEHGDPGHTNIAFSPRLNRYILIDIEDIKAKDASENFDLHYFIEDLKIHLNKNSSNDENEDPQIKNILDKLLKKIEMDWYKVKEEEITFLGKKKKRIHTISEYKPGDLSKILQKSL